MQLPYSKPNDQEQIIPTTFILDIIEVEILIPEQEDELFDQITKFLMQWLQEMVNIIFISEQDLV